jgi:hypothetical protein
MHFEPECIPFDTKNMPFKTKCMHFDAFGIASSASGTLAVGDLSTADAAELKELFLPGS